MSDYKTFTSQDLMKAMGLQVGDIIEIFVLTCCETLKYEINQQDNDVIYLKSMKNGDKIPLHAVITEYTQYKILPKPKRVGDLKCNNECFRNNGQCPIRAICSHCNLISSNKTLYEFLEFYKDKYANEVEFDQEIYDLLKARLDKEVEE